MISYKYSCIFIHIPKCGGSSIEAFLRENAEGLGWKKENGLDYTMRGSGLAKVINLHPHYFTFTFVRNPFDRFVSIWKHSERGKGDYFDRCRKNLALKEYAYLIKDGDPGKLSSFDKYHSKKQIDFILDYNKDCFFSVPRKTNDNCDYIGRFENLQNDFKEVCRKINLNKHSLKTSTYAPDRMKGVSKHYSSYYDRETVEIVREIYNEDIEYLGYKFEKKRYNIDMKFPFQKLISRLSSEQ